ncbi:hypothetical protein OG987_42645 [Streptomyces sp. NBC_01620]|uniref:hypothetical protein n=1 Tax=Streptomyces sp. NBC_01620 TaxID=2975902 RepID=UPI003864C5F0|nr:hypothetical protein OG987_00025 [Streptomyces sp. NBC_01620]WTE56754.1 hypothetical protein OG987_42645 [Streptomyces sp. NBC_01620]
MAPSMDQALQEWARRASDEELDAGPRLEDFGGADAVVAEADTLAAGPQLPYLLTALAHGLDTIPADQAAPLLAAVARGLRQPHSAWVLADALDVVCTRPELAARLGNRIVRDLATLAEDALAGDCDAALAQPAIAGLLRLAVAGGSPHRLLALLTEITGTEAADALDRLPILIGIARDHFADTDHLLDVLNALENQPDLNPATRADASFELALADERTALEAADRTTADEQLQRALMRFTELDRTHEARLDARAHAAAIEAVLAFAGLEQNPTGNNNARQRLTDAADQLDTTAAHLAAWTGRMHQLDWLSARSLTQSAWSKLVTTLNAAQAHLDQPSWYNPADALNDLLQIYLASRSIHAPANDSPGLTALISPAVEAPFVRSQGLLHQLEQALAHDPQFTDHPDAQTLYDAVHRRRQQSAGETARQEAVPGKALEGRPALAALFRSDATGLRDDLDPHQLDRLENLAHQLARGYTSTGNARVDTHLETLLDILKTSPAWKPSDSHYFTPLLEHFLRFLYDRFDAQANLYGERTAYLGPTRKNAEGTVVSWNEKNLQDDFHQHISPLFPPGSVEREKWDVASGRADVIYTPELGSRFVAEIKWRTTRWKTHETVERDYLAQAANYTATGPPFALLLVGDASDHSHGYRDIEDSIWIIKHARSATEIPRLIVAGVLPTTRPTPHSLRVARSSPPR